MPITIVDPPNELGRARKQVVVQRSTLSRTPGGGRKEEPTYVIAFMAYVTTNKGRADLTEVGNDAESLYFKSRLVIVDLPGADIKERDTLLITNSDIETVDPNDWVIQEKIEVLGVSSYEFNTQVSGRLAA
jgi:hypothetical protein